MKKVLASLAAICAVLALSLPILNYFKLSKPLSEVIDSDARNAGIKVNATFGNYYKSEVLVFDLTDVSDQNSAADVFRVFLQFSKKINNMEFDSVILSFRGKYKFRIEGGYFNKLGSELDSQNPLYTIRTFPENLYTLDGKRAYGSWTGGLFGVLSKQMGEFNDFHDQWYRNDLIAELKRK